VTVLGLTATAARASWAVESFSAMPVILEDLSEHDRVLQKANTVAAKTNSLRFTILAMNRTTDFSVASNQLLG
jgi:glycerol dehydrogenase-like iron-containing ADH family enzyme